MVEVGIASTTAALETQKLKQLQDRAKAYQGALKELGAQIEILLERVSTTSSNDPRWAAPFQAYWDQLEAAKMVSSAYYIALLEAFYQV